MFFLANLEIKTWMSEAKMDLCFMCHILPFFLKLAPAKARTCNIYNYAKSSWIIYLFDYTTKIVDICIWTHWSEDLAILRLTPNPFSHTSLVVRCRFFNNQLINLNFQQTWSARHVELSPMFSVSVKSQLARSISIINCRLVSQPQIPDKRSAIG